MDLIIFKDVAFAYNGNMVLENIDLTIKAGDYIYIVGENGSGKTTFLMGLLGLKKPDQGEIIFTSHLNKNQIGYIPQQKNIKKDFPASVMEIVLSGRLNYKKGLFYSKKDKDLALEKLRQLGILNLRDKSYRKLSGGQQQRVLIARALCATEKLLVLDEPDTGLDPQAKEELYAMLEYLNREEKITIIMVTHDVRYEMARGSKLYRVANGRIELEREVGE